MELNEIKQVLIEAAEVYMDLEDEQPRLDSREGQIALLQYNLEQAVEALDELDVVDPEGYDREVEWIEDLEQVLEALQAQEIAARINEATQALFDPANTTRVGQLVAQAQGAYREAQQVLTESEMERVRYAMDAFEVQVQGL